MTILTPVQCLKPLTKVSSTMLSKALEYAMRGLHIFPCSPGGKEPIQIGADSSGNPIRLPWGKNATKDQDTVERWWACWPTANIGLACKASRLVAIDVDVKNGGINSWQRLCEHYHDSIPKTVTSHTGGGGYHLLFLAPVNVTIGNGTGALPPGIDVRGCGGNHGGYIVLPPSIHPSGNQYHWYSGYGPDTYAIAALPQILIDLINTRPRSTPSLSHFATTTDKPTDIEGIVRRLAHATEGTRSNLLLWSACRLFDRGISLADVEGLLLPVALAVGLVERECQATIRSAERQERHPVLFRHSVASSVQLGPINTQLRQIREKYRRHHA